MASSTSAGYLPNSNQSMSPSSFNPTAMSLSDPNNPLARLQGASADPTSNPFDLKIRRPVLKGLWPSNRKEKKEKKNEKKTSTNPKLTKPTANPQQPTNIIDEQNLPEETNEFHRMMGSIEGINQLPNLTKSKCVSALSPPFDRSIDRPMISANAGAVHAVESVASAQRDRPSGLSKHDSVLQLGDAQIE